MSFPLIFCEKRLSLNNYKKTGKSDLKKKGKKE